MQTGKFFSRTIVRIPLIIWTLAVLYPIVWMVLGAFKSNAEIYANPWGLPESFSFANFVDAWSNYNIDTSVFNSFIVTGLGGYADPYDGHTDILRSGAHALPRQPSVVYPVYFCDDDSNGSRLDSIVLFIDAAEPSG